MMKLTSIAVLLSLGQSAVACAPGNMQPLHQMRSTLKNNFQKREIIPQEMTTNQDNVTHWSVAQNMRQMQVTDDAFIARDMPRFNHHPNITVYYTGGVTMNLTEHLEDMRLTYSTTDITIHNHDYKILFGESDWTVAMAEVSGLQNGPLPSLSGTLLPPTNKQYKMDLMTVARWNNGWMMEEFLWSDNPAMYRSLGVLPSPPSDGLPDLELNLATPLSSVPGQDNSAINKAAILRGDDALNNGNFTLESLNLSPDVAVYGLTDKPLNAQGYINWLQGMKTAFPNLRLENDPYFRPVIGQGDWTATVAFLSGTHQGNLSLPLYISDAPVKPTGENFSLLHFTIARWKEGKIVGMRVNLDLFGILASLNITL